MRIIAVTQARIGSSRLPGKVMKKIGDSTLLELHIHRILESARIDELIVATTTNPEDAAITEIAKKCNVASYSGSVDDVLDRFYQSVKDFKPDYVVRLTSDCPLIDAALIDKVIDYTIGQKLDYCSNTFETNFPDGQDIEVFKFSALEQAWLEAKLVSEREHVTPYIWKNSKYKGGALFSSDNYGEGYEFGHLRMTVDEAADFDLISRLIAELGTNKTWLEYARHLDGNQEIKQLNEKIGRNEGYTKSVSNETQINPSVE